MTFYEMLKIWLDRLKNAWRGKKSLSRGGPGHRVRRGSVVLSTLVRIFIIVIAVTGALTWPFYFPHPDLAFEKCIHWGQTGSLWEHSVRAMHANGSIFLLFLLYWQLGHGLYYGAYRHK